MAYNVLIVDDSSPMRKVIKKTITACGFDTGQFHEAENGKEALIILRKEWLDIVITDYNMPDMNGIETCKRLRSEAKFTGPIIFLTGADDIETVRECLAAGGDDYILKSAQPNEFLRRVNRWVEGDLDVLRSRGAK